MTDKKKNNVLLYEDVIALSEWLKNYRIDFGDTPIRFERLRTKAGEALKIIIPKTGFVRVLKALGEKGPVVKNTSHGKPIKSTSFHSSIARTRKAIRILAKAIDSLDLIEDEELFNTINAVLTAVPYESSYDVSMRNRGENFDIETEE